MIKYVNGNGVNNSGVIHSCFIGIKVGHFICLLIFLPVVIFSYKIVIEHHTEKKRSGVLFGIYIKMEMFIYSYLTLAKEI